MSFRPALAIDTRVVKGLGAGDTEPVGAPAARYPEPVCSTGPGYAGDVHLASLLFFPGRACPGRDFLLSERV